MKFHYLILFMFSTILIITCAKQMPPRGGPVDKTPPTIEKITPHPGATNVPTDTKIEIIFSEQMVRKTVDGAIFISPWPAEEIFYKWKGKKLKIEFSDSLKKDKTYVLTIGAKSSDLRNNKMKDSFSLAFSTGDKIDEGHIGGTVYDQSNVEGTLVCAYSISDTTEPDPSAVLADYYTQCNQQGDYNLMYVAPGNYRLFAINDRDQNRRYTKGVDAIGITNFDVLLTQKTKNIEDVNFQMSIEDTVLLFLKSAYAVDQSKIAVRFSEAVNKFDLETPEIHFRITPENDLNKTLKIVSCFQDSRDPSTVHLITENQQAISYNLEAQKLFDLSGNGLDSVYSSVPFEGSSAPDTIRPVIVYKSLEDSTKGIKIDSLFQVVFSEPIQKFPLERNFTFREKDSFEVMGKFLWNTPATVTFVPDSSLKYFAEYVVKIPVDSIADIQGNFLNDSLGSVFFKTISKDTLTSISGKFIDKSDSTNGMVFLTAKSPVNTYNISIEKPGDYLFDKIFPGIYTISAFRDADSNGTYSYGKVLPFIPSERFIFFPDSIKVRSRWPNEGNDIILK